MMHSNAAVATALFSCLASAGCGGEGARLSADASLESDSGAAASGDAIADTSLDGVDLDALAEGGDADLPGPSGGHALLAASDGISTSQVVNWEVAKHSVYQTVEFDRKDIAIFGRRGIVRYLDPEHGSVIYPDEGYNYVHVLAEVDVNVAAVPPGFSAPADAGAARLPDAGISPPYSTVPVASVPGPTGSDFVFARERNDAVIVSRPKVSTFRATGTLDLSSFVDPSDGDGKIDAVDALYDPATGFMFAALARIDRTRSTWPEGLPSCNGPEPLLVALQPVLKTIVDVSPALGVPTIALFGRAPTSIEVEPDGERIFVLSAGCIGEGGAVEKRGIEMVDLEKHAHTWFVDLGAMPRPLRLMIYEFGHALVQFEDHRLFRWTTSKTTLDAEVVHAPFPLAPITENWVIGFDPAGKGLVLVNTWLDEAFPRDPSPISLPGATPHGSGYGWP